MKRVAGFLACLLSAVWHCAAAEPEPSPAPPAGEAWLEPEDCPTRLPRFYARSEALFLKRDNRSIDQPLVLDIKTGQTLLTTGDLGFDFQAGPRLLLGYHLDECSAVELGYWGMHDWLSQAGVVRENRLSLPPDLGLVLIDFSRADGMRVAYGSKLHNAELNYWRGGQTFSWLVGFRYLSWDETFQIRAVDSDAGASDYHIRAGNDLFGGQLGLRVRQEWGRWGCELTGKGGLLGNAANQETLLRDFDNELQVRNLRADTGRLAFVGEASWNCTYRLTPRLSLCGGYHLLWLEGLALAPDQLDFTNTPASSTALHTSGSAFLHGANVGLEARW